MSTNQRIIVEPTMEQLNATVATVIQSAVCEAVARAGVCNIALSGGTTPRGLYQHLAQQATRVDVPWSRVGIFWGDERDVPHDNVESNYHMATRVLLDFLPLDPHRIYPMPTERDDLEAGALEYEATLRQAVPANDDGWPVFDLILLGMGADGHVGSLFPGSWAVEETQRLIVSPFVPVLGRRRMTFTVPLINAARCVLFLVTGEDKTTVVHEVLADPAQAATTRPAARIQPTDGLLIYAMDTAAARQTVHAH